MRPPAPARHPMTRLLLLVAVACGVAGMHTLGHAHGDTSDGHGTHATAMPAAHTALTHHAALALAVDHLTDAAPADPTRSVDPAEVCLAILTGAALLLALIAARRTGRRPTASRSRPTPPGAPGRGPPRFVPTSLRYADLTVLRI